MLEAASLRTAGRCRSSACIRAWRTCCCVRATLDACRSPQTSLRFCRERDLLRGAPGSRDADVRTRLELLRGDRAPPTSTGCASSAPAACRASSLDACGERDGDAAAASDAGVLLAFAYPDRIGRRRPGGDARYTLANGRGAHFAEAQSLGRQEFIVAVDLDDRERDARILLAAPLARADIEKHFADQHRAHRVRRVEFARAGRDGAPRGATRRARSRRAAAAAGACRTRRAPPCCRASASSASTRCPGPATHATCRRAWSSCASATPEGRVAGGGRCIARRIARHLARALARRHHAPRSSVAHLLLTEALRALLAVRSAAPARRARAHASRSAHRLAHPHRLSRRERAGRLGAPAGSVRPRAVAATRRRARPRSPSSCSRPRSGPCR